MRSGPAAIACLLLGLALTLPACGDEQTTAAERASIASTGAETTRGREPGPVGSKSSDPAAARRCRRSLGGFLDSMESLNNSLAVGLSYDDYLNAVNHVRSTYAPIRADDLSLVCLAQVASPAERALNAYIDAANAWGNCLAAASCDPESIEPELQRRWVGASSFLSESQRELSVSAPAPG